MLKFLTICFLAFFACTAAKPHLLTTGVSYATPAVVTPVVTQPVLTHPVITHPVVTHPVVAATAVHTPFVAAAGYYPAYTAPFATYPHLGGAAYFVRQSPCQKSQAEIKEQHTKQQ
ncbi:hypothetical protein DOY81_002885 [Sarcophaga bullata]|nr:hypothetical protein DOY81_002885 [Sarcophaga bullata]